MPIQPAQKTIEDYKRAYGLANGMQINVSYNKGWFTIGDGWKVAKVRESKILQFTNELEWRLRRKAEQGKASNQPRNQE